MQVRVFSVQVQPVPLIAVGTSVCSTLGSVSLTVTVPIVGPAFALSLTVMVYSLPEEPRSNMPLCVFVMAKLAWATFRVAVAVLPVPPLVELTAPLTLL